MYFNSCCKLKNVIIITLLQYIFRRNALKTLLKTQNIRSTDASGVQVRLLEHLAGICGAGQDRDQKKWLTFFSYRSLPRGGYNNGTESAGCCTT